MAPLSLQDHGGGLLLLGSADHLDLRVADQVLAGRTDLLESGHLHRDAERVLVVDAYGHGLVGLRVGHLDQSADRELAGTGGQRGRVGHLTAGGGTAAVDERRHAALGLGIATGGLGGFAGRGSRRLAGLGIALLRLALLLVLLVLLILVGLGVVLALPVTVAGARVGTRAGVSARARVGDDVARVAGVERHVAVVGVVLAALVVAALVVAIALLGVAAGHAVVGLVAAGLAVGVAVLLGLRALQVDRLRAGDRVDRGDDLDLGGADQVLARRAHLFERGRLHGDTERVLVVDPHCHGLVRGRVGDLHHRTHREDAGPSRQRLRVGNLTGGGGASSRDERGIARLLLLVGLALVLRGEAQSRTECNNADTGRDDRAQPSAAWSAVGAG